MSKLVKERRMHEMKKSILSFALPLLLALSPASAQAARLLWVSVDGDATVTGAGEVDQYQSGAINALRVSVPNGNATDYLVFAHEDEQGQMVVGDTAPVVRELDFVNGGVDWVPLGLADGYTDTNLVVTMELGYVDWANNASLDTFEMLAYATNSLGQLLDAPHVSIQGDLNAPALTPWTPDEYTPLAWTISYTLDGGVNDDGNPDIYTSADLPITLEDATREGYTFAGWTNESGVVVTAIAEGTTGDLAFGATWLENVEPPVLDSKTYTAAHQTATVPESEGYTVASNVGGTDVDDYDVTLSLATGYIWSDGSRADKTLEWSITPAPLTVTADAKTKTFGTADPELTYTSSGLLGSDTFSGALSRDAGENVGTYAINQNTLTAGANYTLTYTGANLEITPATAVIPVAVSDLVYDGTSKTGVAGGTGYAISGNTETDAGNYVATLTLAANYKWSDNTTSATKTIPWSIAPKVATITVTDSTKTYGASDPSFTGTVDGLVNANDLGTITYSRTGNEENVGTYDDVLTATYTANANYSVSVVPGYF